MPKNRIIGGRFQDAEGNPIANGWITMELCTDTQETSGPSQVVGGLKLKIPLDNNGNVADTVMVWPNDVLQPANNCYLVDAFTQDGTRAWKSPQYQKVASSPTPFDISIWIPTPNGGCGCANQPTGVLLQTNGVTNASQAVENLISGTGITLVSDSNGGTTITSSSGGPLLQTDGVDNTLQSVENLIAGTGIDLSADGAGGTTISVVSTLVSGQNLVTGNLFSGGEGGSHRNTTLFVLIPGSSLTPSPTFKIIMNVAKQPFFVGAVTIGQMAILKTDISRTTVLSSTPVLIGGSGTPTITVPVGSDQHNPQIITSDTVSLVLDNSHDYYFAVYFSDVDPNGFWDMSNCPASIMPTFFSGTGNQVGAATIPQPLSWGTGAIGRFVSRVVVP